MDAEVSRWERRMGRWVWTGERGRAALGEWAREKRSSWTAKREERKRRKSMGRWGDGRDAWGGETGGEEGVEMCWMAGQRGAARDSLGAREEGGREGGAATVGTRGSHYSSVIVSFVGKYSGADVDGAVVIVPHNDGPQSCGVWLTSCLFLHLPSTGAQTVLSRARDGLLIIVHVPHNDKPQSCGVRLASCLILHPAIHWSSNCLASNIWWMSYFCAS